MLQEAIVELAQTLGWRVYHTFDSRRSAIGFPDLVMVRERVIYAEVKAEGGVLSHAQEAWLGALQAAEQEVYIWEPDQVPEIGRSLQRRPRTI